MLLEYITFLVLLYEHGSEIKALKLLKLLNEIYSAKPFKPCNYNAFTLHTREKLVYKI